MVDAAHGTAEAAVALLAALLPAPDRSIVRRMMRSPRFMVSFLSAALVAVMSLASCTVNPAPSSPGTSPGPTSPMPTDPNSPTSPSSPGQPQPGNPATPPPPPPGSNPPSAAACVRTGCSNTVCVEAGKEVMTTCEYRAEYACYGTATCERQANGACGFTQTAALTSCVANARK
jgi:hypothetical protein